GAVRQPRRRRAAIVALGTATANRPTLLLLGAVSLMARQRVDAGQPHPADRCAQRLPGRQAQETRRCDRGRRTVATSAGADRAFAAAFGASRDSRRAAGYSGIGPVNDARCEISIKLPSGSRIIEMRATLPSVIGAVPSHTPIETRRRCSPSQSRTWIVM